MSADDIVKQLRRISTTLRIADHPDNRVILNAQPANYYAAAMGDAADEIERLRAELDRVSGGRWTAAELDAAKWQARELTLRMAEWSEPRPVGEA